MDDRFNAVGSDPTVRTAVRFKSNDTDCAAWHFD
jgi:hypothetical protein